MSIQSTIHDTVYRGYIIYRIHGGKTCQVLHRNFGNILLNHGTYQQCVNFIDARIKQQKESAIEAVTQ